MPGPSSSTTQSQTRGGAGPSETAFGGISLQQAIADLGENVRLTQDPLMRVQSIDSEIASIQQQLDDAKEIAAGGRPLGFQDVPQVFGPKGSERWRAAVDQANTERQNLAKSQQVALANKLNSLQAEKAALPAQAKEYQSQLELNRAVRQRLSDFVTGKDIGVSPEERNLITQGISGISQDVATTRGLNRTDVPVMQAVAPAVSAALLQQANANRSLFTGINQFQQGLDLSNRQLQLGLAGQNPAANLTGVYSGLRPNSMSGNAQQNYGALDYINTAAKLAGGIGGLMSGMGAMSGGGGSMFQGGLGLGGGMSNMYSAPIGPIGMPS